MRVSLTEEEDEVIMVRSEHREKTLEEWSLSLLGRFHKTTPINFRAAENHLRSVWKMEGNDLKITDVGDGLFRFKFSTESQLKWVINNGPWSFDNHILLLRRWEKGMTAFSVNFQTVPMWVQVWGLPFDLIYKEAGRDIGQGIGRVIEVDCEAIASGEARFLRVRVDVPLDKPIRGGAPVRSPEGDKVWVAFKYERLSGLCFHCGLLGHEAKACEFTKLKVWEESPYGEWLRATEDVPPQTSDSLVAETEPQQNFNSDHGHSYHSRTIIEEGIPEIMEAVECTELNEEQYWDSNDEKNPEINAIPAPQKTIIEEGIPEIMEAVECTELEGPHINEEQYWVSNDGKNPEINAIPALQETIIEEGIPEIMEAVECTELEGPETNAIDMLGKSSSGSVLAWLEQKLGLFYPKLLLSRGCGWLCDAFLWLLKDLTVFKRLMISLASGKAVWDAIFRKESVREFQWTTYTEPDLETRILQLIIDTVKAKVRDFIEEYLSLVSDLFQPSKLLESP